ncbi:hypothetical protein AG1IA_09185 [Rhizoctonia solani AG-1 IA]|uniref:DUF6533 domain-containing protein n=1 Tax=Thanatephorus cucumeris (strain AG1-IA) TaxID=983506 RepID=L8WJ99_THACA|nr:hypothetical protein AG1IA_09185 [Rhizoctonia solani AG-1 IA]
MGLEGLTHATEIPIASGKIWELKEVENLTIGMQATRYLARKWPGNASLLLTFDREFQVASLVFLLYDISANTIDLESEYVWSSPWNFGRIVFHFNRIFAPSLQLPWVLISLLTLGVLVSLPPILIISIVFKQAIHLNENPAPDVIPGCLFGGASKWSWVPYIGTTLYETLLFALTVYKDTLLYHAARLDTNFALSSREHIHDSRFEDSHCFESERHERIREQVMSISETIRVPRFRRNQDLSYWGIIEVDRTRLHIASGKGRDGELVMREEVIGIAAEEEAQSQLAPLPVMHIPGGPGLRSGWIRRDSEGEIVVK